MKTLPLTKGTKMKKLIVIAFGLMLLFTPVVVFAHDSEPHDEINNSIDGATDSVRNGLESAADNTTKASDATSNAADVASEKTTEGAEKVTKGVWQWLWDWLFKNGLIVFLFGVAFWGFVIIGGLILLIKLIKR